jgi:hypothetical protein
MTRKQSAIISLVTTQISSEIAEYEGMLEHISTESNAPNAVAQTIVADLLRERRTMLERLRRLAP